MDSLKAFLQREPSEEAFMREVRGEKFRQVLPPGADLAEIHEGIQRLPADGFVRVREGAAHKIESMLQAGRTEGMHRMDDSLFRLATEGKISGEEAYRKASDKARFVRFVEGT